MLAPVCDALCVKFGVPKIPYHHFPRIVVEPEDNPEAQATFNSLWRSPFDISAFDFSRPEISVSPSAPFEAFVEEVGHFIHFYYLTLNDPADNRHVPGEVIHPLQNFSTVNLWSDQLSQFSEHRYFDSWDPQDEYVTSIMFGAFFSIMEVVGTVARHLLVKDPNTASCAPHGELRIDKDTFRIEINGFSQSLPNGWHLEDEDISFQPPFKDLLDTLRTRGLLETVQILDASQRKFAVYLSEVMDPLHIVTEDLRSVSLSDLVMAELIGFCRAPTSWIGREVGEACARRLLRDPASAEEFYKVAFTPHYGLDIWMASLLRYADGESV